MGIKEIFRRQGGLGLLRQYFRGGALGTAILEFIILGKDRKALEILRLAAEYKIKKKLEKKYAAKILAFNDRYEDNLPHRQSNKVWVCWFQGMENAPELVRRCYQSLQDNLTDRDIILITAQNMGKYVRFPEYIMEKWRLGQISNTHMTDLLRLELLIRYGGMWIDATVLCTCKREDIPDYFFDSDLFFYQALKPGLDGQSAFVSSWLISASANNKVLMLTRYLCYEYWLTHKDMVDYYLFHDFMCIALEHNVEDWKRVVPRDNEGPHILLLRLFEEYNEQLFDCVTGQEPFHKLSYKFSSDQFERTDTFYRKIMNEQILQSTGS